MLVRNRSHIYTFVQALLAARGLKFNEWAEPPHWANWDTIMFSTPKWGISAMNHRNLQEAPNKVLRKVYDRLGNPGYVLETLRRPARYQQTKMHPHWGSADLDKKTVHFQYLHSARLVRKDALEPNYHPRPPLPGWRTVGCEGLRQR